VSLTYFAETEGQILLPLFSWAAGWSKWTSSKGIRDWSFVRLRCWSPCAVGESFLEWVFALVWMRDALLGYPLIKKLAV